jgi:hypothetical protein
MSSPAPWCKGQTARYQSKSGSPMFISGSFPVEITLELASFEKVSPPLYGLPGAFSQRMFSCYACSSLLQPRVDFVTTLLRLGLLRIESSFFERGDVTNVEIWG